MCCGPSARRCFGWTLTSNHGSKVRIDCSRCVLPQRGVDAYELADFAASLARPDFTSTPCCICREIIPVRDVLASSALPCFPLSLFLSLLCARSVSTTPAPVDGPTPAPVDVTTPAPVDVPTPAPVGGSPTPVPLYDATPAPMEVTGERFGHVARSSQRLPSGWGVWCCVFSCLRPSYSYTSRSNAAGEQIVPGEAEKPSSWRSFGMFIFRFTENRNHMHT